ncbi:phage integrase N-terminal domain-containing protein [Geomonas propionica]|uniref:Integrase domain-containing protein n=1 Tax=Geomonas propionica TaxID=2798582 RepID=A0ABS0YPH5_9BACT|nr:phage integrase N-terminal domain-containing protein [Geomonas propionica]MBJ6799872.1 integrase domain-containing protein [Geomonas propionica]
MGKMSLERQALERIGKNWSKASETREKLLNNVSQFTRFIENRYHLERIENLKPGMITAYAADMAVQGLSASTMANRMTAVRQICGAIGKQGICSKENFAYGIERVRVNPQSVNVGKLEEIRSVLAERAACGNRVAQMMVAADSLRCNFGLRAKESLLTTKVIEQDGKPFLKVEGAKGGRVRLLPVDSPIKEAAVKLVQETAIQLGSGTGRIIPPEMSLKAAYDAQRNLWRALGGTKASSANIHGERHLHAREMHADGATRKEIMVDLGHGESRSPAAYGVT